MYVKYLILVIALVCGGYCSAQTTDLNEIQPHKEYDNVLVKKLTTDKHSSSFVIWVKSSVKPHRHVKHSETLYVIEGEAEMTLGDKTFIIKAGDFIHIPQNTVHSVTKVLSDTPIKVLSVQAPEFFGTDRVYEEEKK